MAPRVSTLPIQPKIPEISVGTWNRTDHLGLIRPEYLGAALKVVYFDRSGYWGRSDRIKCLFRFEKIDVPSTALLYPAYKNDNQARGGLGRVWATRMYRSIEHVEFLKFQNRIFVEWNAPHVYPYIIRRGSR